MIGLPESDLLEKGQVCQVECALMAILSNPARPHHLKNFRQLPGDRKILWDLVVRHWVLRASHPKLRVLSYDSSVY
jgi:hypothetical protein